MGLTPLAPLTTLRLGGPASMVVEASTEAELVSALKRHPRALLIAGGSNLLIADEGVRQPVILVRTRGVSRDGPRLRVAAGESWDDLVASCVAEGLAGFECLSGIPGSVGATPIQNVGAYGQEVAETVVSVHVLDRASGETRKLGPGLCRFGYRTSIFKQQPTRFAVLAVEFELRDDRNGGLTRYAELAREAGARPGSRVPVAEVRAAVLRLRRGKGMVVDPDDPDSVSAGSFFTNPILERFAYEKLVQRASEAWPHTKGAHKGAGAGGGQASTVPPAWSEPDGRVKTSAAWLIERAGFERGYGRGRVGISTKHTLALVNRGGGTTAELVALAREIARRVDERFGVDLHPEPVFVGHEW